MPQVTGKLIQGVGWTLLEQPCPTCRVLSTAPCHWSGTQQSEFGNPCSTMFWWQHVQWELQQTHATPYCSKESGIYVKAWLKFCWFHDLEHAIHEQNWSWGTQSWSCKSSRGRNPTLQFTSLQLIPSLLFCLSHLLYLFRFLTSLCVKIPFNNMFYFNC